MHSNRSCWYRVLSLCAAVGLAAPALAQPANNMCGVNQASFTIPGTGGVVTGTTTASTVDGAGCAGTGGDVYWYFTPSTSGPWALSLCSTTPTFDTVLSVHTACPANGASLVAANACNDDSCGLLSDLPSVTLTAGVTYIVRVANYGGASGTVRLSVSAPLPPAQNNNCATIAGQPTFNFTGTGFTVSGSLTGATTDGWSNIAGGVSGCADANTPAAPASRNDVWYRFTPSVTNNFNLTLCSSASTWDSVLSVHTDCPDSGAVVSNTIACNDDGVCSAGVGLSAITDVPLNAGVPVIIRVARWGAGTAATSDQFQLQVSSGPLGACCRADGTCALSAAASCNAPGDSYSGDGSLCATQVCTGACCNPTTGICTSTGPTACASPGVFQSVGTTCAPNPCPQPPPPANDECAGAIVVAPGLPAATGFNNTATTGSGDFHSCVDGVNGVWYSFTAPAAASWQIDTNGTGFDTVLSVFDDCGGTEIDCDDDGGDGLQSLTTLSLSAGQSVRILLSAFGTGTGGAFTLNISTIITGACCDDGTGACIATTTGAAGCTGGTTYQGDNSVCDPNPCPQPPAPANDECAAAQPLSLNVAFTGSNAAATGDGTEGPGGACYVTSPTNFSKAVWFTFTAPATDVFGVTACGSSFDTVVSVFDGTCAAFGSELGCDDDTCDGITPPGSGLASVIAPISLTAGQTYLIRLAVFTAAGATPLGGSYTITVTGTPVVTPGVCCRGATCNTTVAQADCTSTPNGAGATFVSSSTNCNINGSLVTPCCFADYDKSGSAVVADIFAYLNDWFASSPNAVIGGDGTGPGATVANLFDWINAWFAGC